MKKSNLQNDRVAVPTEVETLRQEYITLVYTTKALVKEVQALREEIKAKRKRELNLKRIFKAMFQETGFVAPENGEIPVEKLRTWYNRALCFAAVNAHRLHW